MRISLFLLCFLLSFPASALIAPNNLQGLWLTENKRSVIKIAPCDQGLCGRIHWIIEGGMQYDTKNPDPDDRGEPMCNLPILWGYKQKSDNHWVGGRIYKADDGDIYKANLNLVNQDTLEVHGYVGISLFGKTQKWTRVTEEQYKACKAP